MRTIASVIFGIFVLNSSYSFYHNASSTPGTIVGRNFLTHESLLSDMTIVRF